jgi:hypothetical protein
MMAAEPTLLLDEVENFKKARSESGLAVLAVLNAGHRKGATVPRCEGIGVAFYNVGGFKAFAAIGDWPDTLAARSILLEMRRKRADQETARFLFGMAKVEAAALAGSLEKWTAENEAAVKLSYETGADIEFLSDRDADLWRPLFAVCEVAAPDRLADLQWSARVLSAEKEGHEELLALQLLEVIRTIWPSNESNLATADLLARVKAHKAWAALDISPRLLSNWLRPFDVAPRQVRIGEKTVKGYRRSEFQEAWSHFLGIGGETKETTSADGGEAAISLEDAVA